MMAYFVMAYLNNNNNNNLYIAALDKTVMSCINYSLGTSTSVCLRVDGRNLPLNYGTLHVLNMNETAKCLA